MRYCEKKTHYYLQAISSQQRAFIILIAIILCSSEGYVPLILHPVRIHPVINYEMSPKTNAIYETGGELVGFRRKSSMICRKEIREGFMEEKAISADL